MKNADELKTQRLRIVPLTDEELQQRLYEAATPVEKRKYSELYAGVQLYPSHRLWCTLWELRRKEDGCPVGELYFTGPATQWGEVCLFCRVYPSYQGSGYAGEALQTVLKWAWKDERTYFIVSRPDNSAYADTLQKLGFRETEGRYEIERPIKHHTQPLMSLGVSMGLFAGMLVLGNLNAGILIGALAGGLLGGWLDAKDRRMREKLRQLRE